MRAAMLCLLLTGCANWTQMDCSQAVRTETITWDVTSDPYTTCKKLGGITLDRGGACTTRVGDKATIHAESPAKADDVIIGHEVKHAFGCNHE